jgi:hypothetical protein
MQTLTFEEIDMVSGAGIVSSMASWVVGNGTGYAAGGFVAGVMEGMEMGAVAGPIGIVVGAAAGGAAQYVFAHSLR